MNVMGPFSLLAAVRERLSYVGVFDKAQKSFHQELVDTQDGEVLISTQPLDNDLFEMHDLDHYLSFTDGNTKTGEAFSGAWAKMVKIFIDRNVEKYSWSPDRFTFGVGLTDPFNLFSRLQDFCEMPYFQLLEEAPELLNFYIEKSNQLNQAQGIVRLETPPEMVRKAIEMMDTTLKKFRKTVAPEKLQFYWERFEHLFQGETPDFQNLQDFFEAAKNDNKKKIEDLIKMGIDINTLDEYGCTVLMVSTIANNTTLVEKLLENKANPNLKNRCGITALDMAIKCNHEEIVNKLVKNGAKTAFELDCEDRLCLNQ